MRRRPPDEGLASLAAREVVELLRTGGTTVEELVEVCALRRAAVDSVVASTPVECFDRARRHKASPSSVLCGLPVLVKATTPVAGLPHTEGFVGYKDRVATSSAPIVEALEAAGGVACGLTNVPEFAAGAQCFNGLFPTTGTPYDVRRTSGGSSGGSAAALASRQAWLATGSDLGGSLRTPAAFCGVCGFRTTPGVVGGLDPVVDLNSIDGPMARDVQDLGLFLDAIAPRATSWRAVAEGGARRRPTFTRTAFSTLGCPVHKDLVAVASRAADALAGGAATEKDDPWPIATAKRCFYALRAEKFAVKFEAVPDHHLLKPEIQWNVRAADLGDADEARRLARTVISPAVDDFFRDFDLLATPATLDLPFDKNIRYPVHHYGATLADAPFEDYCAWLAPTSLVSITRCPALVLPCGDVDGLPVGIQLVAAPGKDALLLEAAAALEAILGLPFRFGLLDPVLETKAPFRGSGPTTPEEARAHHDRLVP
ncbi:hypothetical protein CTAYLR_002783 [Chrysophaeum taylorii]|uniref:Amidase domain-containing protein n=1 Tax=Chrysophaeum taylorii TaxID=2483200 RepID=A0AAD7UCL0_9STRA|nr:hypothetical protein CTAYLR_002783 [Chrysophaeum taylorii]